MPTYINKKGCRELKNPSRYARDSTVNLLGQIIPNFITLLLLPKIINGLGVERYGVFLLIWSIIGALPLFDMGLARATTHFVAASRVESAPHHTASLVWCSYIVLIGLGAIMGIIIWAAQTLLVSLLGIPVNLSNEMIDVFNYLAIAFPIMMLMIATRGVLEGFQRFTQVNLIRIAFEFCLILGVAVFAQIGCKLPDIVAYIILVRLLMAIVFLLMGIRVLPELKKFPKVNSVMIGNLFGYSVWISLSNIINYLLNYLDRFFVGYYVSMSAVTYYGVSQEVTNKLQIVPQSIVTTLFPVFSQYRTHGHKKAEKILLISIKVLIFIMTGIVLFLLFAQEHILRIWLGGNFPQNTGPFLMVMVVGFLFSCAAPVVTSHLRGIGYPRQVLVIQAVQLPFYIVTLIFALKTSGAMGAAYIWSGRWIIHMALLFGYEIYRKYLRIEEIAKGGLFMLATITFFVTILSILLVAMKGSLILHYSAMLTTIFIYFYIGWRFILSPGEREWLTKSLYKVSLVFG